MNVFLQLTSAGTNTGPFSLYSDVDGYTVPFQTNISRNQLLLGFMSTLVPTSTTIVRIQSTGDCVQYVDINVEPKAITTTTTSSSTTSTTTSTTSSTTSTTTSSTSTTTTSTTSVPVPLQILLVARALSGDLNVNAIELCGELYNAIVVDLDSVQGVYFLSSNPIPTAGDFLFIDEACTIPFVSPDGIWWGAITEGDVDTTNIYDYTIRIAATGEVLSVQACIDVTTTTTTAAPIRHMEMCVNSTTYDIPNEVNIPYSLSPTVINTPIKAGYNYFFLSIPIDKDFTLLDSLSTNVRSMMSIDLASGVAGVDIRPGYVNNYIYKSSSVFATSLSTEYTITLI